MMIDWIIVDTYISYKSYNEFTQLIDTVCNLVFWSRFENKLEPLHIVNNF